MQLKKLAVICNACFWLTLFFQVWEHARDIHQVILNSVVVLGILAVIINLSWLMIDLYIATKRNPAQKNNKEGESIKSINGRSEWVFNFFNIFSFIAQLTLLGLKLL